MVLKYEPQEDPIRKYFPEEHKFKEVTVRPDIMPRDVLVFKPDTTTIIASRRSSTSVVDAKERKWKVDKVHVVIEPDNSYHTVIESISSLRDEKHPYSEWIENISSDYFDVIEREYEPYDQKLYIPYEYGDIVWQFPNHLYDIYTPNRNKVNKFIWKVGYNSISVEFEEWSYNPYKRGYVEFGFHGQHSYSCYLPYSEYTQQLLYMPISLVKKILTNPENLIRFANSTYKNDGFRDALFGKPYYEQLMSDIGLTFEDLIDALSNSPEPIQKKKTVKKKTTKKKSKVNEMLDGLTEKEKKELLKLLQNGK